MRHTDILHGQNKEPLLMLQHSNHWALKVKGFVFIVGMQCVFSEVRTKF